MSGLLKRDYVIVIMDGSDSNVVGNIIGVVEMMTNSLFNKVTCRTMDKQHPTMKVISTKTNEKTYKQIQDILAEQYPGLCTFDVAV